MTEITQQHLEDAALAAGHKVYGWCVGDSGATYYADIGPDESVSWRPHLDDGDSRRLQIAVKAALSVCFNNHKIAEAWCFQQGQRLMFITLHNGTPSDAARAAREAVVLCAAEIGRRMREGGR